jgi:hypothetical protein
LIEVVDLLKEIVQGCSALEGNDFLLAPSKVRKSTVEGYEIHMTGKFSDEVRDYLNDLTLKKKLSIIQHPVSIMIYRAKPEKYA